MKNPDRLYDLLPAVYRQRDAERGQPLRALLQVITSEVDVVEGEIERLYDNWFIETCDDWVVPYLGDLLGFQLVHEAGQPGDVRTAEGRALDKILIPRREVAHTIAARRRRGTLALLEELARDVAGWPARAVEIYQRLAVTQAINQLQMHRGHTVDVRKLAALDRLGGAFDRIGHGVDVRQIASHRDRGHSNIPTAALFVWRLRAYRVSNTPSYCIEEAGTGENCFTFSVLGNDAPIFAHPQPETEATHLANELNVPAAIRRRAFSKPVVEHGRTLRLEASEDYYGDLTSVRHGDKSLTIRAPGWAGAGDNGVIPRAAIVPADLRGWNRELADNHVAVDPERGRIVFPQEQAPPQGVWVSYYYGFSADIGGGEYRRAISQPPETTLYRAARGELRTQLDLWAEQNPPSAVIELTESEIYDDPVEFEIPAGHSLQIRAAAGTRPIIRLLDHKPNEPDALSVMMNAGSRLVFDGLLITGRSVQIVTAPSATQITEKPAKRGKSSKAKKDDAPNEIKSEPMPTPLEPAAVDVVIRHCTLVPGWTLECNCEPCRPEKGSLHLRNLKGRVSIEHSIVGAIRVQENEVRAEPLELRLSDSVLDATRLEGAALSRPGGSEIAHTDLTILRCTVLGEIHTHILRLAENCIFAGHTCVARRQIGCVRFCYVVPGSRTPRRYECQPDLAEAGALKKLKPTSLSDEQSRATERVRRRVRPRFNRKRYGSPLYCQLAPSCPEEISRGADDESEMGVFHDLFQPQRATNLQARLEEFTPAGMETGIIYVT